MLGGFTQSGPGREMGVPRASSASNESADMAY